MEQVNVWKCEFCKKISLQKRAIKKHEKECFHNPETKSCATCIWFSPLILATGYPYECFVGEIEEVLEGTRMKLKTQCEKWMDLNIYWENETSENQDEMEEKLRSGQKDYFKALKTSNESDVMRKSFSKEVLNAPDPVIKLFRNFVSDPNFG